MQQLIKLSLLKIRKMTNLPKFKSITSIPATKKLLFILEFFLSILFSFVLNLVVLMTHDLFILEDSEYKTYALYSNLTIEKVIIYLLLGVVFLNIILTVYYMICPKTIVSYRIDELGLHEIHTNRKQTKTESILYKNIINSSENGFGLYNEWPVNTDDASLVRCYFIDENKKEKYNIILFFTCKNINELVETFLLGVKTYRPDIVIDPNVFIHWLIDDITFKFDRKTATELNWFVFRLFTIIVLIGLSIIAIILYFMS